MILIAMGTRPEVIKLFPLILEFKSQNIPFKTLFTGQHKDLQKSVSNLIPEYDYELSVMKKGQSLNSLVANILTQSENILTQEHFDYIIVQGDTATVYAAALVAYYQGVRVAHVEAGLRTYDRHQPFPEEMYPKVSPDWISKFRDLLEERDYQLIKQSEIAARHA